MDEVFEQTLSAAPLTERALYSEVRSSISRFTVTRSPDWQGVDARGGALHSTQSDDVEVEAASPENTNMKDEPTSNAGFFSAASEAASGGRRGADFARALQRWLITYVDSLAIDEIEQMALSDGAKAQ